MGKKKFRQNRKWWYRAFKRLLRVYYRKPTFEYIGEKPDKEAIILSNHDGSYAPVMLELYADFPIRLWGTHEMNSGLKKLYGYQSRVYYHQKKHWNLHLARLFCLIASPLTNLYYKGMKLISTYRDARFLKTIKESVSSMKEKGENIVIYPEDSSKGYLKELESFYAGFVVLAQTLFKRGTDVKIFAAYYKRGEKKYIFDKPVLFSDLKAVCKDRHEMANYLLKRCNDLGSSSK